MPIMDYIDGELLSPVMQCDVPLISSERADAIARAIALAIKSHEKIFVYGDYDFDGFACAMVWREVFQLANVPMPTVFNYVQRTHKLDPNIIQQVSDSGCKVVIVCDTGSSIEDQKVIRLLEMSGCVVMVIDHHNYQGDYLEDTKRRLIFNSRCEGLALGDCEVSAAYASLLVAKVLCEKYLHCPLAFNAKVYALASMYSDVVDVSSTLGRALYYSVAGTHAPGPVLFSILNDVGYMFSRRLFSFIIAPKINACFRTGNFFLLNTLLNTNDLFLIKRTVHQIKEVHSDASKLTKPLIERFDRCRVGEFVLCTHVVDQETMMAGVRNFTGVIATRISQQEAAATVVVVKVGRVYEGSVRDYYGRPLQKTFSLFCNAEGHPSAFGLSFSDLAEFKKNLEVIKPTDLGELPTPYVALSSTLLQKSTDIDALALYNEFMNTRTPVMIAHTIPYATLVRSSKWNRFYDVGLFPGMPIRTTRPLVKGMNILMEPVLCKNVEIRELET